MTNNASWALGVYKEIRQEFGDPKELICKAQTLYIEYPWGNHSFDYFTDTPIILGVLRAKAGRHGIHPEETTETS